MGEDNPYYQGLVSEEIDHQKQNKIWWPIVKKGWGRVCNKCDIALVPNSTTCPPSKGNGSLLKSEDWEWEGTPIKFNWYKVLHHSSLGAVGFGLKDW